MEHKFLQAVPFRLFLQSHMSEIFFSKKKFSPFFSITAIRCHNVSFLMMLSIEEGR